MVSKNVSIQLFYFINFYMAKTDCFCVPNHKII